MAVERWQGGGEAGREWREEAPVGGASSRALSRLIGTVHSGKRAIFTNGAGDFRYIL